MTQHKKLLERFCLKPKDFTFDEMKKLLKGLGYREIRSGKTSGSRVAFFHEDKQHLIRFHRPHPSPNLKRYQLDLIEKELHKKELLKWDWFRWLRLSRLLVRSRSERDGWPSGCVRSGLQIVSPGGCCNMSIPVSQGCLAIGLHGIRGGQRATTEEWASISAMMRTTKYVALLAAAY